MDAQHEVPGNLNKDTEVGVWDKTWQSAQDVEFWWWVAREAKSVRLSKIQRYIEKHAGPIAKLRTVEVGSGPGVVSLVLAQAGAEVTLLDYSPDALKLAERYFTEAKLPYHSVQVDVFKFDKALQGQFDVAMSFGTVEHYHYPNRFVISQQHINLVKTGGIVIISVPNRWFVPHEALKFYMQQRGKWHLGYEGAFTRSELSTLGRRLDLHDVEIFGSAFITDLQRYVAIVANTTAVQRLTHGKLKLDFPQHEKIGILDDYFGSDLVMIGQK